VTLRVERECVIQTDYVVAIKESNVNVVNVECWTCQNFTHDGAADDAGIFAALLIFERHLNPTLGHKLWEDRAMACMVKPDQVHMP
jgi:hypothetical protein